MAQLKYYKKVAPNDLFVGILIVYLLIKSLTSNTKEFAIPGATTTDIDPAAWTNLHCILRELYSSGTLTIPGNVHIKGDLLVGTYKDQNDVEKGWDDSIEHTCVWKPKKQGGNNTTGPGWINDASRTTKWRKNSKPTKGGGVFSFRAGHADLHPICISRKQSRSSTVGAGTSDANSPEETNNRKWNPTGTDNIHFRSLTDQVFNKDKKHRIKDIEEIHTNKIQAGEVHTDFLVSLSGASGWIRCYSNFVVDTGKALKMDTGTHLELKGSMRMTKIKEAGRNKYAPLWSSGFAGWSGYVFEDTGDWLRVSDD